MYFSKSSHRDKVGKPFECISQGEKKKNQQAENVQIDQSNILIVLQQIRSS